MKIQESAENYLEAVLMISRRQPDVHAADLCRHTGFSRPTVSQAVKELAADGYLAVDGSNHITLTDKGRAIAERIYEWHTLFTDWLIRLGVDPATAAEDACRIEHVLSQQSFEAIKNFAQELLKAQ